MSESINRNAVWDQAWQRLITLRSDDSEHQLFPGAVLLAGQPGKISYSRAGGWACCYEDGDTLLPEADRLPMRTDTIFDLASVSKLFCSIVILRLVQDGELDLDRQVADYLPEFALGSGRGVGHPNRKGPELVEGLRSLPDKGIITLRQLLTHTSGFPAELPLWRTHPDPESRIRGTLTADLIRAPGSTYCYSDLNLITLGELAQRATGSGLDRLVAELITGPLGMIDTGYCPAPELKHRIAATEYQHIPERGMVWGEVHDENAWALDGVAGHAGVFSTAADLSRLAEVMINNGEHDRGRLLSEELFAAMITNQTPDFPGHDHGLGFELNQPWYMGSLASPRTIGHTGYTGTSLVIDLERRGYVILLTNRVHPSRYRGKVNAARVIAADALAAELSP